MPFYSPGQNQALIEAYHNLDSDTKARLQALLPRKQVDQEHDISDVDSLAQVIKEAKKFATQWNKTIDEVVIYHHCTEEYGSYSSEVLISVKGLESDEQYFARLAKHHETTQVQEKWERENYERLKAKFDK